MKSGGKYYPLYEHLRLSQAEEVTLSLAQIEALLKTDLPASAHTRRDWWGNRKEALQARAWIDAGYHVQSIDLGKKVISFGRPVPRYEVRQEGGITLWNDAMVKALRLHMGLNQAQFAEQLGVRQQTVSEWENNIYTPSRATCKYLSLVAEQAQFPYTTK